MCILKNKWFVDSVCGSISGYIEDVIDNHYFVVRYLIDNKLSSRMRLLEAKDMKSWIFYDYKKDVLPKEVKDKIHKSINEFIHGDNKK